MKYMKFRLLGFVFVLMMVFGCLPVGVDAATTVSQVGVNGIAVPAAGERAREYHTSELTVSGADHRLISMTCCWHDENDLWIDDIDYTFEKGRSYSITVNFEAVGDCQFADADKMSFKFGSAAKNSYTAEVVYLSDDRKVISVKYSFSIEGKRTYDDIERSTFWNINWPMMDGGPSVSYVHLYDNAEVKAFYWTTDGITKQTGRFHGNTLYYLRIEMKADVGYEFSDEWRAYYYRTPMDGEITFSSDYTEATIVVPYFVTNQRTISKVAVGSMILPKGGEYADVVEDDFLSVPVNVRYKLGGFSSFWYDAQGNKLNDTDVFVNGRKYSVTVYFQADDGYGFADPKYIDASFVDLDPSLYTVEVKDTSDKKVLVVCYTFRAQADPPFTLENHIELTGVDLPVAGRDLGTEVSVPFGAAYHVKESDTGQIVQWWKTVDGVETHESGEYYGENTVYTVKIWVEANGKNFDDDHLTATIDGKTAEVAIAHAKSAMITYTFPATGEDYYHISYDVAFDGNGGSGWM
ncbi:MAG: hypothetical protein IKV45_05160, partial [Firmicutes bacterium]|nr:hypothetical protein [Bacillota bacterium]